MSSVDVITKPKVEIDPGLLKEIQSKIHEKGQVVIHILFSTESYDFSTYIRIWPTTYLYDKSSDHRSELVHAENITYYPEWHECIPGQKHYFTLYFSGLPDTCKLFDFQEHCSNQAGAFAAYGIQRNVTDVYFLRMG